MELIARKFAQAGEYDIQTGDETNVHFIKVCEIMSPTRVSEHGEI